MEGTAEGAASGPWRRAVDGRGGRRVRVEGGGTVDGVEGRGVGASAAEAFAGAALRQRRRGAGVVVERQDLAKILESNRFACS